MNPPNFYWSEVNEDPQDFIDKVYKILYAMGLTSNEKFDLTSYQLKDVAQTWCTQWRDNRALREGPITWEVFIRAFIDCLFPREKR